MTTLNNLLSQINSAPDTIEFNDIIALINDTYSYSPAAFQNGDTFNEAGTNEGSCKVFAFAQLNALDKPSTLALFGKYYREDVLQNPEGSDHANIRNFIKTGWEGINFKAVALTAK